MSPRFLIFSCGFGDGHHAAARSLLKSAESAGISTGSKIMDLLEQHYPRSNQVLKEAYSKLIIHAPGIWSFVYDLMERIPVSPSSPIDPLKKLAILMQELLETQRPDAIISTYPAYSHLMQRIRKNLSFSCPLYTVITDSISINKLWVSAPSDGYFVADPKTGDVIAKMGVPKQLIHACGFPVDPLFESLSTLHTPDEKGASILYFPSTPTSHVLQTMEALMPLLEEGIKITVPLGRHAKRLMPFLKDYEDAWPDQIKLLPWCDHVPQLLATHHLTIGKAGGATTHEVLAARCPMLINYIIPGQEEGNAQLLTESGGAFFVKSPEETAQMAAKILDPKSGLRSQMQNAMSSIGSPHAARMIINTILNQLASSHA